MGLNKANAILQRVREKQEKVFKIAQESNDEAYKEGMDTYDNHDEREQKLSPPWMIHPEHVFKIYWDLLIGFFIMYSVIIIPLRLAFQIEQPQLLGLDILGDILFTIDIITSFRTGYYDEDARLGNFIFYISFFMFKNLNFCIYIYFYI